MRGVQFYEADGRELYALLNWSRFQKVQHSTPSVLPVPPTATIGGTASTKECTTSTFGRQYSIDKISEDENRIGEPSVEVAQPRPVSLSLPLQPKQDEDDPLLERMQQHEVTYSVAVTLIAGKEALATAWLNYADAHPNIPNVPALLTKNIRAGRMPPNGHGPPGKPPPRAISGLSEADLEVKCELAKAKAWAAKQNSGPSPPE
jgi:hypothetical protein